jgi:hypothetical protein
MVLSWLDKNTMIKTRWISPSYITIIGLLETTKVQIIQECFSDE